MDINRDRAARMARWAAILSSSRDEARVPPGRMIRAADGLYLIRRHQCCAQVEALMLVHVLEQVPQRAAEARKDQQ